ncbi:hypothetical protein PC116_g5258 [Phytophthora cactorum]|uniref:Uncharacterized protein n=1 Tax=Phytophthora cactorum TaxID=29920 RepID=A0A8T1CJH8_9STRA|nr:hypothetical protein PC112_g16123 [Phytophthora cactorum]KAG2894352.1 hypothetical protein PC114_g15948 [Phytophthora cactorum]KAG2924125.1 hypothetical protein PC117_g15472 [Phytophthora cactorum]KAG2982714.1 hypothetical protein PC119_g20776 [Phytophthora cactorum]KAG3003237.1 hypothetical protein PC120_g19234 [Phytophthora cactorum]
MGASHSSPFDSSLYLLVSVGAAAKTKKHAKLLFSLLSSPLHTSSTVTKTEVQPKTLGQTSTGSGTNDHTNEDKR